jgi:hypothetical protein
LVSGIDKRFVLVGLATSSQGTELWLFDMQAQIATKIGYGDGVLGVLRPIAKDGVIHWQNYSEQKIYSYDKRTPDIMYEYLLASNVTLGEEVKIDFSFSPFSLIWRGDMWYMSSATTGEVFGDENSSILTEFAQLFELHQYLRGSDLERLSLTTALPIESSSPVSE